MEKKLFLIAFALLGTFTIFSQGILKVEKVHAAYLRNSGAIIERNQIKGYFFLYQSDKIDRSTNEYTLQILDQNVNKVIDIKFQDSKQLSLLEAAYNNSSLAFLFKNDETKMLEMKIYNNEGKLKYTYTRMFDKKTEDLMNRYATMHTDEGMNQNIFDLGDKGYSSVFPVREGKQFTYEVDFYSSQSKKQWTYVPTDEEKYAQAEFLGHTDSLIILQVLKKQKGDKPTSHILGINFVTRKKAFEINQENNDKILVPSTILPIEGSNHMIVMGNYFESGDNIMKEYSKGLAVYEIDTKGKTYSKTFSSWTGDFSNYLTTNSKGKIDNIGYLYIHKLVKTPAGKMFVIGEGYKRQASAGGIAATVLTMGRVNAGVTKIVVTDLVVMEFDNDFKLTNASIIDKTNNAALGGPTSDYASQHAIAVYLKATGAFDYEFTTGEIDNSVFSICYSDWVRDSDYKGQTFNSLRYTGEKFVNDKIELKSKASKMRILPAKPGSIMIMEYFKKEKKLEFRIEKLG